MLGKEARGDDSGRPYMMLAARVAAKRVENWGTMTRRVRRVGRCRRVRGYRPMVSDARLSVVFLAGGENVSVNEAKLPSSCME